MPSTGLIIEKMFNAWTDWLLSKKSIFLSLALVETLCLSDDRSILLQFFVHFEIDTPWVHTIWSFYINDPKIFSFHHKCRPRQTVFLCVAQRKSSNFISNDNFFINSLITEFSLENFNEKKRCLPSAHPHCDGSIKLRPREKQALKWQNVRTRKPNYDRKKCTCYLNGQGNSNKK